MNNTEKKQIAKRRAGTIVYMVAALQSQRLIRQKVKKQPGCDIALQVSNAFWAIVHILYQYYCVGKSKEA